MRVTVDLTEDEWEALEDQTIIDVDVRKLTVKADDQTSHRTVLLAEGIGTATTPHATGGTWLRLYTKEAPDGEGTQD